MPTPDQIEAVYRVIDKAGIDGATPGLMNIFGHKHMPNHIIRECIAKLEYQNRVTSIGGWYVTVAAIEREKVFQAECRRRGYSKRGIPVLGKAHCQVRA